MDSVCALSTSVIGPLRVPLADGVKVMLRVQELCAASDAPQFVTAANSGLEGVRLVIASATSPELDSVTLCAALPVFTCCAAKLNDAALSVSVAAR